MNVITTNEALAEICERVAHHPFVTVDTEFLRETTFWPKLCVIQLASPDEAVAIDALSPDLDLEPFFVLMRNTAVLKVFHAARQDLEIIWKMSGSVPAPLFDTQVAAMVCGYGDQVSYEQLAGSLAGARIDKTSRFTDWSRRPLTEAQIEYALADVTHLRTVYLKLAQRLEKTGRAYWLDEEMAILSAPSTYEQKPAEAWLRLRNRARKPRDLAIIMELAEWREAEAQTRDVPRSRVLKDDTIAEIATAAPATSEQLGRMRTLPNGFERSKAGAEILAAVARGLARDPATLPAVERARGLTNGASATVQLLKVLLQSVSEKTHVAVKLIASVEELEAIAMDDLADVPALKGWRHDLFGAKALELKNGLMALAIRGGRVELVPVGDAFAAGSAAAHADV